ncbi:hypothetical protein ACQR3P_04600 [Rhodococcus sp. IEGM1300]
MNLLNNTDQLALVDATPFDPHVLALNAQEAAAAFLAAGTATNTVRSYRGALTYLSAWLQLRYGQALGGAPLPATVAIQFVLDHLARPLSNGTWAHLLPPAIDAALVAARVKGELGALLATCSDGVRGVRGVRDRALLLLAWSGGGRRRSEVVGQQVDDVRRLDADT